MDCRNNRKLLIHATNISGYGAQEVVVSLLDALSALGILRGSVIEITEVMRQKAATWHAAGAEVRYCRRVLPNSVSRFFECLFAVRERKLYSQCLVLGDVPLPETQRQTVLVHQSNLVLPGLNVYSSRKLRYQVLRWVFRRNIRFAHKFVVQTGVMQQQMVESYPELNGRIVVMPQPAPNWLKRTAARRSYAKGQPLCLFYPAAGFIHKNHVLLKSMDSCMNLVQPLELTVTLNLYEQARLRLSGGWLRNVGKLDPGECLKTYEQSDALFFPSLLESYGLPLVEAMVFGLPVVCSDLPFARWLCEEQAIYFDPSSPTAAWQAIRELQKRLDSGWHPDWSKALSKLPKDWNEVARLFLDIMGLPSGGTLEGRG
jgi:glycosyltransferase involved in cell wall biosynthesis